MQNQFVEDLLDLIRLRVKPLLHYSYPWWQPALLVTLLGVFSAAMAEQFSAPPEGRILFFVALNWLELLLMANFFDWWLRQGNRWNGEGSLLPLLAVAQGIQVLEPGRDPRVSLHTFPCDYIISCNAGQGQEAVAGPPAEPARQRQDFGG